MSEPRPQRGYGSVIYGESGLGDVPADERGALPAAGGFAGRGPKGYRRSDERIRDDISVQLSDDDLVDATEISVSVVDGHVTLEGSTETRRQKQRAELIAAAVAGVSDVHNRLTVLPGTARR